MNRPSPDRWIGVWLLSVAFLVYLMIGVGGYTRLSESGLSIVQWKPVTGWLPPLTVEQWEECFSAYRKSPEFQKVNSHMNLEDFKEIFYPEYFHRVFGRVIGLAFFIPYFFFVCTRRLYGKKAWGYLSIGLLGGLQGAVGWFMVKSGLIDRPDVSAYRLALHLSLAGLILWLCYVKGLRECFKLTQPFKFSLLFLLTLVALQIASGALVSGQHAGVALQATLTFNPDVLWLSNMGFKNFSENLATILLIHICLGVLIFCLSFLHVFKSAFKPVSKLPLLIFFIAVCLQIGLGWFTVTHYSPKSLSLSLAHQLCAFIVLLSLTTCALLSEEVHQISNQTQTS